MENGTRGLYAFDTDDTIMGFAMQGHFVERFGLPDTPRFNLRVRITTSQRSASITSGGDTSRLNIIGAAEWTLTDIASGQRVTSGTAEAFTSYAATGSTVATQTAQDDARNRLSVILADMIVTRVMAEAL